jgi:hypothetical protein
MVSIGVYAVVVITIHAFWCLLSRRVSDGIVGKFLYLFLVLAALGELSRPNSQVADAVLYCSFAAVGFRHWWMKTIWPRLRICMINHIRCATCPHKEKR